MQSRDGGPAFPHDNQELGHKHRVAQPGMSLRDWFAGQALAGLCANANLMDHLTGDGEITDARFAASVAQGAAFMADAMLEAREVRS